MLLAVLDDTGTHDAAKYSSCIGVVAGLQHWKRFEREWRKRLERYDVKDFHAERFYARDEHGERVSQFRGWSDEQAGRFIGEMMALFTSMKAGVVGASVDTAAFRGLTEGERAFLTGQVVVSQTGETLGSGAPQTPFFLAFATAVNQALAYGEDKTSLHVVLDNDKRHETQAAMICYQIFRASNKHSGLLRGFNTYPRNDFVSLHLADEIAYLWNRCVTRKRLTAEQSFVMDKVLSKGGSIVGFDADTFSRLRKDNADFFKLLGYIPEPD